MTLNAAATTEQVDVRRGMRWGLLVAVGVVGAVSGAALIALTMTGSQDAELVATSAAEPAPTTPPPPATSSPATTAAEDVFRTTVSADTSTMSAPTTTIAARTTTSLPTAAVSTLPIGPEDSLRESEPYRYSFSNELAPPELPTSLDGFAVYDGPDAAGLSGPVRSSTLRLFDGGGVLIPVGDFSTQMNGCAETFWVVRWVVKNPDVRVVATNELDPIFGSGGYVEDEPWLLPPAARSGMMGNSICYAPGFKFDSTVNGNESNLVDVVVEWTYFDRDAFAPPEAATSGCADYAYDSELPIAVCSQSLSVELFQEALGLPADGFFGPGTETAVKDYQVQTGLAVTGVMDAATWSALGVTEFAPYPDLNGDGVIDASEFGE